MSWSAGGPDGPHAADDRPDGEQHPQRLEAWGVVRPAGHHAGDAEDEHEPGEQAADDRCRPGPAHSSTHSSRSPGWQPSTRHVASRVLNRTASAGPFFSAATSAGVSPFSSRPRWRW